MENQLRLTDQEERQYVIFSLGGQSYAVEVAQVLSVERDLEIVSVPGMPHYMKGVGNLRDEVLPVFGLREKFSMLASKEEQLVMVLLVRGTKMGVVVDQVKDVISIPASRISPVPQVVEGKQVVDFLQGIARTEQGVILLLDIEKVLTSEEIYRLADLAQFASETTMFSDLRIDALQELGNIGAGKAATALSEMLGRTIRMSIPSTKLLHFNEMIDELGGPGQVAVTTVLDVQGDIEGKMFFLIDPAMAKRLVTFFTGKEEEVDAFGEMAESLLNEIGNILVSSYFSALADLTGLRIEMSVPRLAIDMQGAILSEGLSEMDQLSNQIILVEAKIYTDDRMSFTGVFCFVPQPQSVNVLFRTLGV